MTVPTPGKNRQRYVAGALHARTGRMVWVEHSSKSSLLFMTLAKALLHTYRRARRLTLILDNYNHPPQSAHPALAGQASEIAAALPARLPPLGQPHHEHLRGP